MADYNDDGSWTPGDADNTDDEARKQALQDALNQQQTTAAAPGPTMAPPSDGSFTPTDTKSPTVYTDPAPGQPAPPPVVNLQPPAAPTPPPVITPTPDAPPPPPAAAAPAPAPAPAPPPPDSGTWDAAKVSQYFASRGVTPFPTSVDYWTQAWNTWGKADPAYFQSRLAQADEFTGKGPNYDWQKAGVADPGQSATPGAPVVPPAVAPPPNPGGNGASTPAAAIPGAQGLGTDAASQQFGSDLKNQLMELLRQGPVTQDDPEIAPTLIANRDARQRALRKQQDDLAESYGSQNLLHSGAYDAAVGSANEVAASDTAQFAGNTVNTAALARRQQITSLLATGAGMFTAEQQQQLQLELANIDAQLRQQSITNQNTQFNDNLGFEIGNQQALLNRQSMLDAMGVHI